MANCDSSSVEKWAKLNAACRRSFVSRSSPANVTISSMGDAAACPASLSASASLGSKTLPLFELRLMVPSAAPNPIFFAFARLSSPPSSSDVLLMAMLAGVSSYATYGVFALGTPAYNARHRFEATCSSTNESESCAPSSLTSGPGFSSGRSGPLVVCPSACDMASADTTWAGRPPLITEYMRQYHRSRAIH